MKAEIELKTDPQWGGEWFGFVKNADGYNILLPQDAIGAREQFVAIILGYADPVELI